MKINMLANELVDGEISFVSLVQHGANYSPFKIVKSKDQEPNFWGGLLPEFDELQARLDRPNEHRENEMTMKIQKDELDNSDREIAGLRHRLAGLYSQQQNLWESPQTPVFEKFDNELTFQIEKTESALRILTSDDVQMAKTSAFFRRGGSSTHSAATISDSAFNQSASVCKAENSIDLSPTVTTTDDDQVNKIDLNGMRF